MPTLVYRGETWPLELTGPVDRFFGTAASASGAPALQAELRWTLAYGSNASPGRLMEKGLDASGALLLPASRRWFRARVGGTSLGWPAGDFSGNGRIRGALLRPVSSEAAVALYATCDRIEDAPALFRRVAVVVVHDHVAHWAASYEWNPEQEPAPGAEVASGRWLP